jgi:hypothetical protein
MHAVRRNSSGYRQGLGVFTVAGGVSLGLILVGTAQARLCPPYVPNYMTAVLFFVMAGQSRPKDRVASARHSRPSTSFLLKLS